MLRRYYLLGTMVMINLLIIIHEYSLAYEGLLFFRFWAKFWVSKDKGVSIYCQN